MFELFMLNNEVKELEKTSGNYIKSSILHINMDWLMTYYIVIQNLMFVVVFALLKPTKQNLEEIQRWRKKDLHRLNMYRNNARDTHEPFMYVKKGDRIDSGIHSE